MDLHHLRGVFFISLALSSFCAIHSAGCPPPPQVTTSDIAYNTSGSANSSLDYLYIGGLFAIHEAGNDPYECGDLVRERGIVNMEAFFWAISTFPSRHGYPSDVSVRAFAFDTCSSEDLLANKLLNLENCVIGYTPVGKPAIEQGRVYGYVGPESNAEAIKAATILGSKDKILVSYAANAPELSDSNIYKYFQRTIPSGESEIRILRKVILALGVSEVQVVFSGKMHGMLSSLEETLKDESDDVAIMNKQEFSSTSATSVIDSLLKLKQYYVVVLLTDIKSTIQFFQAAKRENVRGYFTYVGPSSWGANSSLIGDYGEEARGAITLAYSSSINKDVLKIFDKYLQSDPTYSHKSWAETYFRQTGKSTISSSDIYIPYTIAAVDAIMYGIHETKKKVCGQGLCSAFTGSSNTVDDIYGYVLERTQEDSKFDILHLRPPGDYGCGSSNYCYVKAIEGIGPDDPQEKIDVDELYSFDDKGNRKNLFGRKVSPTMSSTMSSTGLSSTTPVPADRQTIAPSDPPSGLREGSWVIVLIILAALGILFAVLFEIYILYRLGASKRTAGMSHKRTIWLGQLLLLGVFLSYLTLFAFVPRQTVATCTLIRLGVGCSYALCFSVLLVKLMIILSSETIGYLKGIFQVIMLIFAWGVQLVVDIEWLILVKPDVDPATGTCTPSIKHHIQSLVYVMFLIVFTTILSIPTRNIATNHREGFFIGLTSGFSIPIWVAWVLFALIKHDTDFDDPILAFALFINATMILFIMFFPKVRQLTSMGVEGIYAEDDKTDMATVIPAGSVYAGSTIIPQSVAYLPTNHQAPDGSIILVNGGAYSEMGPIRRIPEDQLQMPHDGALHLRHAGSDAGSLRSVPMNSGLFSTARGDDIYTDTRVLNVTNSLTGRYHAEPPIENRRTQSEVRAPIYRRGYIPASSRGSTPSTVRKFRSVVDLGSL